MVRCIGDLHWSSSCLSAALSNVRLCSWISVQRSDWLALSCTKSLMLIVSRCVWQSEPLEWVREWYLIYTIMECWVNCPCTSPSLLSIAVKTTSLRNGSIRLGSIPLFPPLPSILPYSWRVGSKCLCKVCTFGLLSHRHDVLARKRSAIDISTCLLWRGIVMIASLQRRRG